ncbi:MAG: hypothetical protein IT236_10520 [Bacteroidia bacterium]|nr:hypothetical protein [Bacteroidia bacterium]
MTPVLATVCLMEFAFEVLGVETLKAKMSAANEKVIEFNKRIGYTRAEYQSDNQFHYYHTNKEAFNKAITGIRETLQKLNSGVFEIDITTSEMKELLLNPSHLSLRDLKLKITEG